MDTSVIQTLTAYNTPWCPRSLLGFVGCPALGAALRPAAIPASLLLPQRWSLCRSSWTQRDRSGRHGDWALSPKDSLQSIILHKCYRYFIVTKCRTVLQLHAFFSVFWVNITFIISMPKHSLYQRQTFSCTYKHKCIHVVLSQYRSMYALVADDSREATLHASLVLEIKGFLCLWKKTDGCNWSVLRCNPSCVTVWLQDCQQTTLKSIYQQMLLSLHYTWWWWWLLLYSAILRSSRLTALACDSTWVTSFLKRAFEYPPKWCAYSVSAQVLCTPYSHASCHFMQSHIHKVYACLAVTCHLHFWQNDRNLLRATAVTRGWNWYWNKSQHRK